MTMKTGAAWTSQDPTSHPKGDRKLPAEGCLAGRGHCPEVARPAAGSAVSTFTAGDGSVPRS